MAEIVQRENIVLRQKASPVPQKNINSPRIKRIISAMKTALDSQQDGIAIAAPQIGESVRIFIVSEKVFDLSESVEARQEQQESLNPEKYQKLVFINPTITRLSRTKEFMEEGCLSVRWLYGKVKRSTKATVRAYDEKGELFERGASGILAQVFQHEIDHLDGVLFIDKAIDVTEMNPTE
ncbi:MAG: peptide deformylase [Candidatus Taylorbacteria bacterium RIFCSPHIGHO2_01_FULL_46_22b]|uniref:Peptide deformylase n=1 Tax=Candidatus Taylorbacteria bacterium RIFCSPHIGHO2_01_FULL_46_22b TaxID=1802301 RepID=A0A1G2M3V3_9BACT|nr:MAG: peptide deformylase [Candidatus Taylorbacteria bacterium RIFCSPHIGHO2_01_FULL_46_22b]